METTLDRHDASPSSSQGMRSAYDDVTAIADKISSPAIASLLSIHPNDVTLRGQEPPSVWSPWWTWAWDHALARPEHPPAWLGLIRYFARPCGDDKPKVDVPPELCSLVDSVRSLQLQRTPSAFETRNAGERSYRISPKKQHEVDRMSSYIYHLAHSESPRSVWHAVDVGSGQGYLSRALQELDFQVLALDSNENLTSGASRWMTKEAAHKSKRERRTNAESVRKLPQNPSNPPRAKPREQENPGNPQRIDSQTQVSGRGSLTHRTVHVYPRTLEESIADWLTGSPGIQGCNHFGISHSPTRPEPVPIMIVALHACGSLTVDVLRTFLSDRARASQTKDIRHAWRPHSLVVVGCCYNLMSPSDFPLSKSLRDLDPVPKLTTAAAHLAAQMPSQWMKSEDATRGAELALRKVVYRALLQPVLHAAAAQSNALGNHIALSEQPIQPGLGETLENRRLGKLNDKAYQDWPTFLESATDKLGIDLAATSTSLPDWLTHEESRLKMESALFVMQTLRCILGPLIETLIVLDRRDWIQDELAEMNDCGQEVGVEMVNLFDQATGSGRNIALVIRPTATPHSAYPLIERI